MGFWSWLRRVARQAESESAETTAAVAATSTGGPIHGTMPAGTEVGIGEIEHEIAEETDQSEW